MTNKMKYDTIAKVLAEADGLQSKVRTGKESVAGHLMALAVQYKDSESFLLACEHAENDRKTRITEECKTKGESAKGKTAVPAAYSQAKSNIRKVWEAHEGNPEKYRSPKDFKSYSELTIYLNDKANGLRGGTSRKKKDSGTAAATLAALDVSAVILEGRTHAVRLKATFTAILALNDGDQSEVLDEIDTILKDYQTSDGETDISPIPEEVGADDMAALEVAQQQIAVSN